ncbi:interleukin-1 receptor-associated kinase 4 [Plakobranchus ocellatus]|uniref:Interleukin-1 receptor-associated kinase 4 n=1 Tax=Plakobranchus ocellatus TaxID=259542 RepID=A0AAV3XW64_9GAST|nr:interleukin-1 receptor-associated kinase 4 [Plakobranchus ocellatus]
MLMARKIRTLLPETKLTTKPYKSQGTSRHTVKHRYDQNTRNLPRSSARHPYSTLISNQLEQWYCDEADNTSCRLESNTTTLQQTLIDHH